MEITLLDVNDSPPRFDEALYEAEIAENADIGTVVTTLTASDADADSVITYSITGTNSKFSIDNSGKIFNSLMYVVCCTFLTYVVLYLGQVTVSARLDREETDRYSIDISAYDGTYPSSTTLVLAVTDINDEKPRFLRDLYSLTVSERALVGDPIGAVTAVDDDLGDGGIVRYSIQIGRAHV